MPWDSTVKPSDNNWLAPWLRNATEDMRVLMRAYRRERSLGRQHPEWFNVSYMAFYSRNNLVNQ
jgi:hypothetical protein